jgi:hypothetical protein
MFDANNTDETLSFSVFHLNEMLLRLKEKYQAGWHGETSQAAG